MAGEADGAVGEGIALDFIVDCAVVSGWLVQPFVGVECIGWLTCTRYKGNGDDRERGWRIWESHGGLAKTRRWCGWQIQVKVGGRAAAFIERARSAVAGFQGLRASKGCLQSFGVALQ